MTDRAERPWELLPGRSDPCSETRSTGRRPTLWLATEFVFDLLGIGLSEAKGECPKELRDKSEELRVLGNGNQGKSYSYKSRVLFGCKLL